MKTINIINYDKAVLLSGGYNYIYPENSFASCIHRKLVCGDAIDKLFIPWRYISGESLARELSLAKSEKNRCLTATFAENMGLQAWQLVLNPIKRWASQFGREIIIVPVPSRSGFPKLLSEVLAGMLQDDLVLVKRSPQNVLKRVDPHFQIKKIIKWSDRQEVSSSLVSSIHEVGSKKAALLVDDVVASGNTLRACAEHLRTQGVSEIGAAVLCAHLEIYFDQFQQYFENGRMIV